MTPTPFEINTALVMVAVTVAVFVWFRRDLAAGSEREIGEGGGRAELLDQSQARPRELEVEIRSDEPRRIAERPVEPEMVVAEAPREVAEP